MPHCKLENGLWCPRVNVLEVSKQTIYIAPKSALATTYFNQGVTLYLQYLGPFQLPAPQSGTLSRISSVTRPSMQKLFQKFD